MTSREESAFGRWGVAHTRRECFDVGVREVMTRC
jgi:hypothetical protein